MKKKNRLYVEKNLYSLCVEIPEPQPDRQNKYIERRALEPKYILTDKVMHRHLAEKIGGEFIFAISGFIYFD